MQKNSPKEIYLIAGLIVLVLILLSSGCTRKTFRSFEKSQLTTTSIIDTLIQTVPDSSVLRAYFKCDSNNKVVLSQIHHLQSKNASNELLIDSLGKVEVKTLWRTQVIDRERIIRDTTIVYKSIDIETRVPYIPSFIWWIILTLVGTCIILTLLFLRRR